ncbi:MAG: PAS domain-containing protein [Rhodocyclaceae bacterium]|nr:PAS domain-containing protein [Rhodocyclaceae bacterium]
MTRPSRPGLTNDADVRSLASNTLLRLFDSLYEGAVVVDRAGRITWINDKYRALLGLNGADPVEGRAVEEIIPNSRLRHVMESGRAELLDVFAIGSRQVVVSRIPLQDESGVVIGGLGVILYDRVQALKPIVSKFQQMQADLASVRRELAETRRPSTVSARWSGFPPGCAMSRIRRAVPPSAMPPFCSSARPAPARN